MPSKLFASGSDDVVVIVDLSAQLFRAYHAIRPLSSPTGEPTHAVYGVVSMLERLVKDLRPTRLAIALDSGRATFRSTIYPEYKANRPTPPEDLIIQLKRSSDVVRAFTQHVWQKPGWEADDLIATAVRRAEAAGLRSLIVGADKDLMQLCSDTVQLWDTMRDRVIGPAEVQEKFGVRVDQLGDLLALMGDSSDNIPGVPGIGPKTAAELLNAWGSLDGIYAHLADIPRKRLRELLVEHEALARLSRRLVTLDENCEESIDPVSATWTGRDIPRLHALYTELGFTRFAAALNLDPSSTDGSRARARAEDLDAAATSAKPPAHATSPSATAADATRIRSLSELTAWLDDSVSLGPLAVALIRREPRQTHSAPVALSLSRNDETTAVLAFLDPETSPDGLPFDSVLSEIRTYLGRVAQGLITHGCKNLFLAVLPTEHHELPVAFDAELASYLLDPSESHDLAALAERYLGDKSARGLPSGERRGKPQAVGLDTVLANAAGESRLVARVGKVLRPRVEDEGLASLYFEVELPLARILASMQLRGVLIDTTRLSEMSFEMDAEMGRLELAATEAAGHAFNVNSPRQLETILFDEIGLKPQRRTKTSRSTDAATLEALAEEHPLPRLILQHRQVAKLKSTYVDSLPSLVSEKTGRVHSSWEQTIAATGRLSSIEPNLQNIPIRTSLGRAIRKAFVAPPGTKLVSADYSQIELRILAHLSQDPELLEAYRLDQDVHLRTAAAVFELDESSVSQDMRRQAKAVNFGVIYGQGESGLSAALGISRQQASEFIAAYYRKYRGVRKFMNDTLEHARHGKAVASLLGRRRYFNDIDSANRSLRMSAERMAMNMPIQATAADILKLAMLKLEAPVTPGAKMIMTVHDELVFEVPDSEVPEAKRVIAEIMQNVIALAVPLIVDVGVGSNWADAH